MALASTRCEKYLTTLYNRRFTRLVLEEEGLMPYANSYQAILLLKPYGTGFHTVLVTNGPTKDQAVQVQGKMKQVK
jgi:hypothetical protein